MLQHHWTRDPLPLDLTLQSVTLPAYEWFSCLEQDVFPSISMFGNAIIMHMQWNDSSRIQVGQLGTAILAIRSCHYTGLQALECKLPMSSQGTLKFCTCS